MLKYLYTILKSTNPRFFYQKWLFIIIIALIIYYLYKYSEPIKPETFSQEAPFVLKIDLDIYDDFYAGVYDGVTDRSRTCQKELYEIIKMTQPDTNNSTILDIGSGTGCVVGELVDAGYNAYGVDKSVAMIDIAEAKYPNIAFSNADVMDSMAFEKGLFTHILCLNFTIYEIPDKHAFFSNCYHWIKPNGYLVVHLVDREKFSAKTFKDGLMDLAFLWRTMEQPTNKRKLSTSAEFIDYVYDATYEFSEEIVTFKEKFTDKQTQHIRQNENTLHMKSINEILKIASSIGFIVHAKTAMKSCNGDENQYLYVLERAM
jgi:2-polyprenyl-3-methyl-5-hydroxy-6-metoxy-1,4-benzoquinol methylase